MATDFIVQVSLLHCGKYFPKLDCSSIVRSAFSMVHWSRSSGPEQTLDSRQMMMMMEKAKNKSVEIIAMTLRWDRSKSENIKTVLHFLPHSCDRWTTTYQVQSSHSCSGALPRHVERLILIHTTYRLIVILLERKMWERSVSFTQQHGHRCHSLNMIKMYDRKLWQILLTELFVFWPYFSTTKHWSPIFLY